MKGWMFTSLTYNRYSTLVHRPWKPLISAALNLTLGQFKGYFKNWPLSWPCIPYSSFQQAAVCSFSVVSGSLWGVCWKWSKVIFPETLQTTSQGLADHLGVNLSALRDPKPHIFWEICARVPRMDSSIYQIYVFPTLKLPKYSYIL